MARKIYTSLDKTLKLTNVLMKEIDENDIQEITIIDKTIDSIKNYILSKGNRCKGPIIHYSNAAVLDDGEINVTNILGIQTEDYICNVDQPYKIHSVLKVKNCLYCRYIGPEDKIKLAYDKLNVLAFEEGINLKGDSYTIYVNRDDETEEITVDVFMERID